MTDGFPSVAAGATRLVLIRHGEPDEAVRGRCYGRLDPGLSPRGREQMRHAWQQLSTEAVRAIYASPSRRAIESAQLRTVDGLAISVDARLREIDFGEFEGLTYGEIATRFPDQYDAWMARPTEVAFPRGDSFHSMSVRVLEALDNIRRAHRGTTAVIVSHGGVNRIALAAALDLDPSRIFRLDQAYAGVNVIDYLGDEAVVRAVNAFALPPC